MVLYQLICFKNVANLDPLPGSVISIHVRVGNSLRKAADSSSDFGNGSLAFRLLQ